MRTLQNYKSIYREIANNLGLQGDSVEILVQLLANASYISEVEDINYALESSIEKASLMNSKIQHCMDNMYSVFRGQCPRVLIRFKPTKYFSLNLFQEIISSNNFKIYYLGYLKENTYNKTKNYSVGDKVYYNESYWVSLVNDNNSEPSFDSSYWRVDSNLNIESGTSTLAIEDGFEYSQTTIMPGDDYVTIIGLLAKTVTDKLWTVSEDNLIYVSSTETNLSNDIYLYTSLNDNNKYYEITRDFSDHLVNKKIFDLTTTDFGSRLYISGIESDEDLKNANLIARYFNYSSLSDYNEAELKKVKISGGELVSFGDETWRGVNEISKGLIYLSEVGRDDINTVHYKSVKDRYVNSILRSNSDIGVILEEMYPEKVISGGTNYEFNYTTENSDIIIYYVPRDESNLLTQAEIDKFKETRKAYYVTDDIRVETGNVYTASFSIDIELNQPGNIDYEVSSILDKYSRTFEVNLEESIEDIKAEISKISNVKKVKEIEIIYTDSSGSNVTEDNINSIYKNIDNTYFNIKFTINSIIVSAS